MGGGVAHCCDGVCAATSANPGMASRAAPSAATTTRRLKVLSSRVVSHPLYGVPEVLYPRPAGLAVFRPATSAREREWDEARGGGFRSGPALVQSRTGRRGGRDPSREYEGRVKVILRHPERR